MIQKSTWLLFLLVLPLLPGCSALTTTSPSGPRLSFKQQTYNFGRISAAQQVVKEVEFTNTGTLPLVIEDVLPVPPPEGG